MDVLNQMRSVSPVLVQWYRKLHQIPELGFDLTETMDFVGKCLSDMDIEYQILPENAGIIGMIGTQGPVVAIRADMDALDIVEKTNLPFASKNGKMHACGHDGHTAILLAVAKFFKENEKRLPGRIKLIFQAAEEVLEGAKRVVKYGGLENPVPDYVLALHAGVGGIASNLTGGSIALSDCVSSFSSDSIRITVNGRSCHAASPQNSIDPIAIGAQIIEGLQQLMAREVSPNTPAVLSITHFHAGAETYNVIPHQALLMGTIRTVSPQMRAQLLHRAEEIAVGIGKIMGAEIIFENPTGCPATINDSAVAKSVFRSAEKLFPGEVYWMRDANTGSEDAAYLLERIPGCYLFLASMQPDADGKCHPHHNEHFCLDETVLWRGAAVFVQAALDLMLVDA